MKRYEPKYVTVCPDGTVIRTDRRGRWSAFKYPAAPPESPKHIEDDPNE